MNTRIGLLMVAVMTASSAPVLAAKETRKQVVKPPLAQAWIDVATFSGMTMPAMGGMEGMASMMSGMFGGMTGRNAFGNTETGTAGSWVDVTLYARDSPRLEEAIQTVPAGSKLAPELKLVSPRQQKQSAPAPEDDQVVKEDFEPPKGKIYLYWGCGDTVRAGQPKVLDMAKASMADYQSFFANRRATQRGAHLAAGRPVWPNEQDARMVPQGASLVGEHAFKAQGVPDGFNFAIGPAQDIMPAIELNQRETGGVTQLEWQRIPTARAYFLSAMGSRGGGGENEMVFWTSSEVSEMGTGLIDYQTNPAVDKWLKEKVLLSPEVKTCAVPKGILGEGAMLRMIAYGSELQLAHPPRPTDPKIAWEPQWNAKVRVKSVTSTMLGMTTARPERGEAAAGRAYTSQPSGGDANKPEDGIGQGLNKLKGLFGF